MRNELFVLRGVIFTCQLALFHYRCTGLDLSEAAAKRKFHLKPPLAEAKVETCVQVVWAALMLDASIANYTE